MRDNYNMSNMQLYSEELKTCQFLSQCEYSRRDYCKLGVWHAKHQNHVTNIGIQTSVASIISNICQVYIAKHSKASEELTVVTFVFT